MVSYDELIIFPSHSILSYFASFVNTAVFTKLNYSKFIASAKSASNDHRKLACSAMTENTCLSIYQKSAATFVQMDENKFLLKIIIKTLD